MDFTYTQAQLIVLEYIVYVSAPCSVAGSTLIIWVILHQQRTHSNKALLQNSVYHRIMLGLSTLDFFNSFGMLVLGPWALPRQQEDNTSSLHARGNFTTCTMAGFFLVRTCLVVAVAQVSTYHCYFALEKEVFELIWNHIYS